MVNGLHGLDMDWIRLGLSPNKIQLLLGLPLGGNALILCPKIPDTLDDFPEFILSE